MTQFLLVRSKQGLGQARPNKITSKLARVADVKSRWNTRFSRIENLWPRDGSCSLPLRSKSFPGNCFRIVKTQKINRDCAAHVMGSPFAPNEVPAPVLQRRWLKSRYHVRTAHEIFKVRSQKRKIPPTQCSDGFCRVKRRQNDRVCCGAVRSFRGNHPLKVVVITVRTTTFVSRIWNKGYHGSAGASIWFWKIHCDKVVIVRLIVANIQSF